MALGICGILNYTQVINLENKNERVLFAIFVDFALFITFITCGSLAAQKKLPVETTGATIGFFVGTGAILLIDIGALKGIGWHRARKERVEGDSYRWQRIENNGEPYFWNPASEISVWYEPTTHDEEGPLPEGWWHIPDPHCPHYVNVINGTRSSNCRAQPDQDQHRWHRIENNGEPYFWNPASETDVWYEPTTHDEEGDLPKGWWHIPDPHCPHYVNVINGTRSSNCRTQPDQDQHRWHRIENNGEPYFWNPASVRTARYEPTTHDEKGVLPEGWWHIPHPQRPYYVDVIHNERTSERPTE